MNKHEVDFNGKKMESYLVVPVGTIVNVVILSIKIVLRPQSVI